MQTSITTTRKNPMRNALLVLLGVMIVVTTTSLWTCDRAVKTERHVRYVGMLNIASEKIAKTIHGMEMNAMNEFDEVEKHLDSPEDVIAALESKTSLNPEVRGYFAAFEPNYFPRRVRGSNLTYTMWTPMRSRCAWWVRHVTTTISPTGIFAPRSRTRVSGQSLITIMTARASAAITPHLSSPFTTRQDVWPASAVRT